MLFRYASGRVGIIHKPGTEDEPNATQHCMFEHTDLISALAVSDALIASGDCTGDIALWTHTAAVKSHVNCCEGPIRSLAFSQNGQSLVCGELECEVAFCQLIFAFGSVWGRCV